MAAGRSLVVARPQVAAAIRIPERMGAQLRLVFPSAAPRLFVHEGARQALERKLRVAFPGPVILSITDNRHSIITHRVQKGVLHARVHHMFLDAPPAVVDALVRYVTRGDRDASATLGDHIDDNGFRLARRKRNAPLVTKGRHHDLLELFEGINERYFGSSVNAVITWGKRPTRKTKGAPQRTIKLGSYSAVDRLIRIHPALDQKWVPRYFVAYIVYHEMLHHVIPGSRGLGRVNLHPPEFKEREKQFRYFERALEWERRRVARLLRS
ncbi:MAG TPA: hypothetical protein VK762_04785 [Polyangiaceae bacterium]|jgi:hypothetical protein|nr:hypothetical protein [Polyangiaceae bacterium]